MGLKIYKGYKIFPCEQIVGPCQGKGWHVQTYHDTGLPWSEENCAWAMTLKEIKKMISHWRMEEDFV